MKRILFFCLILVAFLVGCGAGEAEPTQAATESSPTVAAAVEPEMTEAMTEEPTQEAEIVEKSLKLLVDGTETPVIWEENASVAELLACAEKAAIDVEMHMYGGWEQVGALGQSISRNDVQTTAENGDIMLYSGNQIVLFYGENSWAYTKLGHIDLPQEEVTALLSGGAVGITLTVS